MNKPKLLIAATSRVLLNVFIVFAMVLLASLIGVGGAALWIYGRPETVRSSAKSPFLHLKTDAAANDTRDLPQLSPIRSDDDTPTQLTPARYMPTDTEIATLSDTPRYTYISYNGGRQQAHLRVITVVSDSTPAALVTSTNEDAVSARSADRPPLSDSASHYITDAHGRVIGIDGSAGAAVEARAQQVTVARALPVQPNPVNPEVRVASPVIIRKALPVEDEAAPASAEFNVQDELSREDDRPVLRAQPVARPTHTAQPSTFGASDSFPPFGRD